MEGSRISLSYLSLGSNLGDRLAYLKQAVQLLGQECCSSLISSHVYETEPVGYLNQGCFLNAVVCIETMLGPLELLRHSQGIENRLMRKRTIRFGPRTIDIDLLTYDEQVLATPELTLPHPRMARRAFVLVPLLELNPKLIIHGRSVEALAARLSKSQLAGVRRTDYSLD